MCVCFVFCGGRRQPKEQKTYASTYHTNTRHICANAYYLHICMWVSTVKNGLQKTYNKWDKYWGSFIKFLWPCRICRVVGTWFLRIEDCLDQTIKLFPSPYLFYFIFFWNACVSWIGRTVLFDLGMLFYTAPTHILTHKEMCKKFGEATKMKIEDHGVWYIVNCISMGLTQSYVSMELTPNQY